MERQVDAVEKRLADGRPVSPGRYEAECPDAERQQSQRTLAQGDGVDPL